MLSYLGDLAGRRFARSRRRLWGLRPKHASAIWAGFSGIVVSGFIFGLLSWVSADVRDAIFKIEELKEEFQTVSIQMEDATASLALLEIRNEALLEDQGRLQGDLAEKNETILRLDAERLTAEEELLAIATEVESLQGEISGLESERDVAQEESGQRLYQLNLLKTALVDVEDDLAKKQGEVEVLTATRAALEEQVLQLGAALLEAEALPGEGTMLFPKGLELRRYLFRQEATPEAMEEGLASQFVLLESELERLEVRLGTETPESLSRQAMEVWDNSLGWQFLRVIAATNAFRGEGVRLTMSWVPVRAVFPKGEVVVRRFFQESGDLNTNYGRLEEMLGEASRLAGDRGVLPDRLSQKRVLYPLASLVEIAREMTNFTGGVLVEIEATSAIPNFEILTPERIRFNLRSLEE